MSDRTQWREQDGPVDFELINVLMEDVTRTLATLRQPFDQPTLRAVFRATFAAVEGITHYLKHEALRHADECTPDELALLREESYALTHSGEVSVSRRRLPSAYNFVFAARMALRPLQPDIVVDPHDPGRLAFERAIHVRHRITHPRELRDLQITNEEVRCLVEGFQWCSGLLMRFEQAVLDLLKGGLEAIDQMFQEYVARQNKSDSQQGNTDEEV